MVAQVVLRLPHFASCCLAGGRKLVGAYRQFVSDGEGLGCGSAVCHVGDGLLISHNDEVVILVVSDDSCGEAAVSSCPVLECGFYRCVDDGNILGEEICVCIVVVGQTQIEECTLAHAVTVAAAACTNAAVVAWIQDADEEPAVAAASPTPIEVEEVVAIEAVEHEGMTATRGET